jgi:hypothetical protein
MALASTSDAAWQAFRTVFRPEQKYAITGNILSDEERDLWISWMTAVFMPANRRSVDLITSKAHLVTGGSMPSCFLEFGAHVAGYEVVVRQWEKGNYVDLKAVAPHPRERYHNYIQTTFSELKRRQERLLSLTRGK